MFLFPGKAKESIFKKYIKEKGQAKIIGKNYRWRFGHQAGTTKLELRSPRSCKKLKFVLSIYL
jgi:hypothetical protein